MYTHPIEDENCKNILNSIIFEKAISLTSAFGAVFRVRINHEPSALKVIGDTQLGRNELEILCAIKKEILDKIFMEWKITQEQVDDICVIGFRV